MGVPVLSARGNEINGLKGTTVARRRFQQPTPKKYGAYWKIRVRDDVEQSGGDVKRPQRWVVLGLVKEMTLKMALRARDAAVAEINSVNYRPQLAATLKDFGERWTNSISVTHKRATRYAERYMLEKLVAKWGSHTLKEVEMNPEGVQAWISGLEYSPGTVINIANLGRRLFATAKRWRYVNHNPFSDLVLPKRGVKERFAFTSEQMRSLVESAEEPYKTLFWICAETGLRIGEALGLDATSIDLKSGVLLVKQSVFLRKVQTTKSARPREFYVSPMLQEHLKQRMPESGLLFRTVNGKAMYDHDVRRDQLRPLCMLLRIPLPKGTGFHAFRHGNASVLDRLGIPMRIRQDRLGHVKEETTMRYTHALSTDHQNAAMEVGKLVAPTVQ
jgi:integrase